MKLIVSVACLICGLFLLFHDDPIIVNRGFLLIILGSLK